MYVPVSEAMIWSQSENTHSNHDDGLASCRSPIQRHRWRHAHTVFAELQRKIIENESTLDERHLPAES